MQFCYLVRRSIQTEDTLTQIKHCLKRYHALREIFRTTGTRPDGFSSFIRHHSIDHYPGHITNFGAPNGLCSSITESKHIKAVKEPWRRSSKHNALGQILRTNCRTDKIAAAHVDFAARGMLQGTCLSEAVRSFVLTQGEDHNSDDDELEGSLEDNEAGSEDEDEDDAIEGIHVLGDVSLAKQYRASLSL